MQFISLVSIHTCLPSIPPKRCRLTISGYHFNTAQCCLFLTFPRSAGEDSCVGLNVLLSSFVLRKLGPTSVTLGPT